MEYQITFPPDCAENQIVATTLIGELKTSGTEKKGERNFASKKAPATFDSRRMVRLNSRDCEDTEALRLIMQEINDLRQQLKQMYQICIILGDSNVSALIYEVLEKSMQCEAESPVDVRDQLKLFRERARNELNSLE